MQLRCGHLFNGIGGFALAASWMNWENVMHCEIDSFCNKVMNYHFPNSHQHEDIRTTDFTIWRGKIDLITGGFPCQPYSTAGKRKGKDDDRHLWPQMLRAIREIQPGWIVGENVRGLTNWNGGLVFDEVQADLEVEGYEVLPFLLPAAGVNAPHRRDRIWFVAHNKANIREGSNRRCGELQFFKSMVVEGTQAGLCISNREIERARKEVENNFNAQAFDECAEGGRSGSQESKQVRQSDGESSNSKPLYKRAQQGEGGWSAQAEGKEQMVCTDLCQQSEDSYRVFRYERGGFEGKDSGGNKAWNYTCFQWPIAYSANARAESLRRRKNEIHESGATSNPAGIRCGGHIYQGEALQRDEQACGKIGAGNNKDGVIANTNHVNGRDGAGWQDGEEINYSRSDWQEFPTQSPVCNRNDGIPSGLADWPVPSKKYGRRILKGKQVYGRWRKESLKALGNAVVPQVVYQIFKAIEQWQLSQE